MAQKPLSNAPTLSFLVPLPPGGQSATCNAIGSTSSRGHVRNARVTQTFCSVEWWRCDAPGLSSCRRRQRSIRCTWPEAVFPTGQSVPPPWLLSRRAMPCRLVTSRLPYFAFSGVEVESEGFFYLSIRMCLRPSLRLRLHHGIRYCHARDGSRDGLGLSSTMMATTRQPSCHSQSTGDPEPKVGG